MSWKNKNDNKRYEDRYKEVEDDILCNVKECEIYLDIDYIDYEELQKFNFVQWDEEEDNAEFSLINPNLLDLDFADSDSVSNAPILSTIIDNFLLHNEQFHEICSQLNKGQQHLLSVIMCYALHCELAKKNNKLPPKPYHMFFNAVSGIGINFLITAITEYIKWVLGYPNQNLDKPSVLVTVSTGNTATGVNCIRLHSAFHLPVKSGLKSFQYKKPGDESLHIFKQNTG